MMKRERVMIDSELWVRIQYHFQCDDTDTENIKHIKRLIAEKQEAIEKRQAYGDWKQNGSEQAKEQYLNLVGVPNSFRY